MSRTLKITCEFCGDEFTAERISAKFCKPAHRIAYNRLHRRIANQMNAAMDRIWEISDLCKKHPHLHPDTDAAFVLIGEYMAAHKANGNKKLKKIQQSK